MKPEQPTRIQIHLRIPGVLDRKKAWMRAAAGKPLAVWAGEALDMAARLTEDLRQVRAVAKAEFERMKNER